MIMAAAILLAVALQPVIELIWPAIDSTVIGGLRTSSYIPMVGFIALTFIAASQLRRIGADRVSLWAILIAPALWLSLMLFILFRPPGHPAVNQTSIYILLSGLLPVVSTQVGWIVAGPSRNDSPIHRSNTTGS